MDADSGWKKYLMFENDKNNCWLDSSLALISYNQTFRSVVQEFPKSQINYIIAKHAEAVAILNDPDNNIEDKLKITRSILVKIQQSTLQYLQHFSNFKEGEPDSAFCALLNLILQDKSNIKEQLCASWSWIKHCTNCGNHSKYDSPMKPIITLPKVKNFEPESPISFYTCSCKTEQEMKLLYKLLPSCLIFHFENGAGDGETYPLFFTVEERKYHLTSVVVFEKSSDPNLNHFVTYVREPSLNLWLDCNDLNTTFVSFSSEQPEFALKDVCMYVFEAFDNLGKISVDVSVDNEKNLENMHVECIDLVNEGEEVKVPLRNADDEDNSSNLHPSVEKGENLLNAKKLAEKRELGKKKASKINLPLKKAIKERQLNTDSNEIPVTSKESDKLDTDCDMLSNSSNIQKVEAKNLLDSVSHAGKSHVIKENINNEAKKVKVKTKESLSNFSGDQNIDASIENRNEDQTNLQSLTGIPADMTNNQSFVKNVSLSLSSKVNSTRPIDEQKSEESKSDELLSEKASELNQIRKQEAHFDKATGSIENEQCLTNYTSEKNSEISTSKKKLDKVDKHAENSNADAIKELKEQHSDSISSNRIEQKTTTSTSKSSIDTYFQQTSFKKGGLFTSKLKKAHHEIKQSSSEVDMPSQATAETQSNMLSPSATKSESGESEQLLKDKKVENIAKFVAARKEASNGELAESNVCESVTTSTKPKNVKGKKPEKAQSSHAPDGESRSTTDETNNDSFEVGAESNACKSIPTSSKPKKVGKTKKPEKVPPSQVHDGERQRTTDKTNSDELDAESNACKSTPISTKPKKKTKKSEKVPRSRAHDGGRRRTPSETNDDSDEVDAKVRALVDDVVPRTVAAFMEQLILRYARPT